MSKWIDKLKVWLLGEREDEERQNKEYVSEQKGKNFSYSKREIEGKVQHVYPRAGAYRFPLHVQQEESPSPLPQKRGKPSRRKEQEKDTSRYFQGNLSQSTEIPSPIYGYRSLYNEEATQQNERRRIERTEQNEYAGLSKYEEEISEIAELKITSAEVEEKTASPLNQEDEFLNENSFLQDKVELGFKKKKEVEPVHSAAIPVTSQTSTLVAKHTLRPVTNTVTDSFSRNLEVVSTSQRENEREFPAYSYRRPDLSSLKRGRYIENEEEEEWVEAQAKLLMETFESFNLKATLTGVTRGPTVTRFEIQPAPGIKINRFTNLQDDLKLSLAAKDIRIEAPIPGKQAIGIEVPNLQAKPVLLGDILTSSKFQESGSPLTICLGADLSGNPVVTDIQNMPHGLIAGSTGSGKSVCINSILVSLLYKASPEQLRLLLIDPKVVELSPYQSIPHLVTPVVTDPKEANAALKWAVEEMERRYQLFADLGVRDLNRYNHVLAVETNKKHTLPYIVIIIDELADLMMVAPQDVEESICRLTQKARACGIHLIVATQRPSVDVITGLIKANIPTRLAFSVSSQVDSRTILDMVGAERLLGKGDMLFLPNGAGKAFRLQGNFVSDEEIEAIVSHVSITGSQHFLFTSAQLQTALQETEAEDELIEEVALFVLEQGVASASSLQRKFRIGYNRAARMIDWMEEQGMISEAMGSRPRNVIWSEDQFLSWLELQQNNE